MAFLEHLNQCWEAWDNTSENFVAPYFALFQSSGYGKSALLKQIAKNNRFVLLYLSFADSESLAIPTGSPIATTLMSKGANFDNEREAEKYFCDFLIASLRVLTDADRRYFGMEPRELYMFESRPSLSEADEGN